MYSDPLDPLSLLPSSDEVSTSWSEGRAAVGSAEAESEKSEGVGGDITRD